MYERLKGIILPLLKIEDVHPHPPAGFDPHDEIDIERADPAYLSYLLFYWRLYLVVWTLAIIALIAALLIVDWRWVFLAIPIALFAAAKAAVLYVTTRLDYEMRWYIITDRSLLIREGVWSTREITLTFANAQNVRVTQGPIQRIFGFANVEIDTAGGGGGGKKGEQGIDTHKAVLRGLSNPKHVRDRIRAILRAYRGAGLGDPDEVDHELPAHQFDLSLLADVAAECRGMLGALERSRR